MTAPRCSRTLRPVIADGPVLVSVPVTVTSEPGVIVRGSKRPTTMVALAESQRLRERIIAAGAS